MIITDCHVHIFGGYPFWEKRSYTPDVATLAQLKVMHDKLNVQRTVLIQPSPYGVDNRAHFEALKTLGASARLVVVIDESVSDKTLQEMHAYGACGVRLNWHNNALPSDAQAQLDYVASRLPHKNWHIQIFSNLKMIAALKMPACRVVVDHLGFVDSSTGFTQNGFESLMSRLKSGQIYIKLSGFNRISGDKPIAPLAPFIRAMLATNSAQLVWGTDWPHVIHGKTSDPFKVQPFEKVDEQACLNLIQSLATPQQMAQILESNPAELYGF